MRLLEAIQRLGQAQATGSSQPSGGSGAAPYFEQAVVQSCSPLGILTVTCSAGTVTATPVTDEPIKTGMLVWVSQSSEGYIVHGGVR